MTTPDIEDAFRGLVAAFVGPDALPAGGAAGVVTIAMGVALGIKVIRLSPEGPTELSEVSVRLEELLERLLPEFAADCSAFAGLLAEIRRPREDAQRADAIRAAWQVATAAPVAVAAIAADAETLLSRCTDRINPRLAGDLIAALELVRAGRRIAVSNARENARQLAPQVAKGLLGPLANEPDGDD